MDQLIDWMIDNDIMAESCNIMTDPKALRMELMPEDIRSQVLDKLLDTVYKHNMKRLDKPMLNRRIQERNQEVITDITFEYVDFIKNYRQPDNIDEQRRNLVKYLTAYENMRNNNILEYLPEYEEFLRSNGYQR